MKKQNTDSIDQLLSETFDDYTVPEFRNSWPKIKKQVFKQRFMKFNVYQFNVYYGIVAVGAMITAGVLLSNPFAPNEDVPVPVEKTEQSSDDSIKELLKEDLSIQEPSAGKDVPERADTEAPSGVMMPVAEDEVPESILPEQEAPDNADIQRQDAPDEKPELPIYKDSAGIDEVILPPLENQKDSLGVLPMTPLQSVEELPEAIADSIVSDSVSQKVKRVIVIEEPVVKRDTVVKVIRKRRR
ncbi:hypothetical protein [Marinilabilia sp.]|uniref:hypothetical protein n=1 Tax=Marinilabilia sp. TaxID=2021252 RepID=UPI0025C47F9E|nr:hypothetical protein [Marinilabilia sp.]